MSLDDPTIIDECRAGNLSRFSELYDKYVPSIFKFVYFKTHHRETAEDITSHVFIKALENISSFDSSKRPFNAWLFAIARNAVIDHYRARKDHRNIEDAWDISNNEDLAHDTDLRMQLAKVQEYMKDLTSEQRDIVLMRVWQGLSYKEIADILEKSEASTKMMFSRTVAKMRKDILIMLLLLISQIKF